jgi:hypothetical protein
MHKENQIKSSRFPLAAMTVVCWISASAHALGQSGGCVLIADEHNPSEKILRCDEHLTIRKAPNSKYQAISAKGQPPSSVRLQSGALMIEFAPTDSKKSFQILTPHAIAAVRGTKWAIEVVGKRTSTLVLSGVVEVKHLNGEGAALLRAGEGADVSDKKGLIVVKRWGKKRVDALLARFGQ